MFESAYFLHGLNNIRWYLWLNPDYRLIECLLLEILCIITFVMSVSSMCTIIAYIKKYEQIICHWTVRFSIGILLLSTILSLCGFILLIYQQNGRHFDFVHLHCKIASILIAIFVILSPTVMYISINSYLKWKSVLINEIANANNIKWYEIKTMQSESDMDLRHLIAVHIKQEKGEKNLLLNEKTNEKIPNEMNIILTAHKSRYKLHLLSFIGQLLLFVTVQYKNYNEEREKLVAWGYRFSKLINEDNYYIAKWELENGIYPKTDETFETLEWLEYAARTNMQNQS